jgi:hypothetical protein
MSRSIVTLSQLRLIAAFGITLVVAGCAGGGTPSTGASSSSQTVAARAISTEPLLSAGGECEAGGAPFSGPAKATEIAVGIGECDLVKLKGAAPTDVLVGESGKGQREAQVLYNEPGGREIYLFTDNKLTRIVKPGQG